VAKDLLVECEGFDWDDGNIGKNWTKHRVTDWECEEVFFNRPLLLSPDVAHSETEPRHYALGQTDRARLLFVSFAIRRKLIRPISARDMSVRERKTYENAKKDTDLQG
jgi:uncharacterized DUF497 family protein